MLTPDLLLENATLLDAVSGETRAASLLIRGGKIARIAESISDDEAGNAERYDASGKLVSIGWMDMHVHLREPGYEHKETIATGARAAAFGGFTAVACMPNTDPPIHTRDVVTFVKERAKDLAVDVHPIACVSKNRAGEALAELADLADAGAVGFSDDGSPVQNAGLMRRALEYAKLTGKPIINHMEELSLGPKGHMNEGRVSTRLGVTPVPALSEELMIARDILLAELTGGHLHVAHISTARAVDLVREGKARGVRVTTEVCTHHLALVDEEVERTGFSTHTKMHPPLRTRADVDACKAGLADGTIDALCTDHAPHASFEKEVEFTAAPFGILGLETAWGLTGRELVAPGVLPLARAVHAWSAAPREILGLPIPALEEGAEACLTIFDADTEWTFGPEHIRSKSRNTPFVGAKMIGKAHAIYNNGQFVRAEAASARKR